MEKVLSADKSPPPDKGKVVFIFRVDIAGATTVQFVLPGVQIGAKVAPGEYGESGGAAFTIVKITKTEIATIIAP